MPDTTVRSLPPSQRRRPVFQPSIAVGLASHQNPNLPDETPSLLIFDFASDTTHHRVPRSDRPRGGRASPVSSDSPGRRMSSSSMVSTGNGLAISPHSSFL